MKTYTWTRGEYTVTTDLSKVDLEKAALLMREDDWTLHDRPVDVTISAFKHSITFIALYGDEPVATVRLITDFTTTAYAADMIVRKDHRGKGVSKFVFECVFDVPVFKNMRRINLQTPDAHGLYAKYGFNCVAHPEEMMERLTPYDVAYASFRENRDAGLIDD
ncbi:MAG: GNAT family N-acetyltransferase [Christensenellaceae bacterium]|nr:GNAT family N-acetyltransferase [Christensenellaceae bacterium]